MSADNFAAEFLYISLLLGSSISLILILNQTSALCLLVIFVSANKQHVGHRSIS
jgi:hypothetical protein